METFCQVGLGVLDENEASTEGIVKVMQHLHKYVPGHGTDKVVPILSGGDLLTAEREQNAQEQESDGRTPTDRLEGLVPTIEDMHTYGNFLGVIIKNISVGK